MSVAEDSHTKMATAPPLGAAPEPPHDPEVTLIRRRPGWQLVDVGELWRYRELLFFLTWRDVKIRYKQSALGVAWAVIQPLANMAVFTLFIGRIAGLAHPTKHHYWMFVLIGFLPWTFFANAITAGSTSVVGNERLVTRIYFPRLIIPFSAVGASLVDFLIAGGLLVCLFPFDPPTLGWGTLMAPVVVAMFLALATGVGTVLAALTVAYRDVRFLMTFAVQLWMLATPIIYLPAIALGPRARTVLPLNPVFGLVHAFRQAVLEGELDEYGWYAFGVSSAVSLILLAAGCLYFRRVERSFADII